MAPGNGSAYHAGGGRSKAAVAAKMPSRRDAGGGGGGGGMEQERAVQDPGLKDYVGLFLSSVLPAVVVGPVWSGAVLLGERIHLVLWLEMRPPPPLAWHVDVLCRLVELSLWRGWTSIGSDN